MARCTEQEVKAIIDTTLTEEQVTPFLRAANIAVTNVTSGYGYGVDDLMEIERWFAAHLIAVRDPRLTEAKQGDGTFKYFVGQAGKSLDATPYGQQVKLLDNKGAFAEIANSKGTAEFEAVNLP